MYAPPGSVTWIPALLTVVTGVAAVVLAILAWREASDPVPHAPQIYWFGVLGFVLGALAASICANVQKQYSKMGQTQGRQQFTILGMIPSQVANLFMIIGLLGAIAAIIPVAVELARQ